MWDRVGGNTAGEHVPHRLLKIDLRACRCRAADLKEKRRGGNG